MESYSRVYIVGLKKQPRFCKVGVTANIERRLIALSTGSPFIPYLYHHYKVDHSKSTYRLENDAHKILSEHRVGGEWFKLPPGEVHERIKHLFPDEVFRFRPINAPRTIEDCVIATNEMRARREAKTTIQDPQTPEEKRPPGMAVAGGSRERVP